VSEILRTEALRKSFGELAAVDGVSLSFAATELTAIIGPNGAGKTTLINLLSGALAPDSGRVLFLGQDITGVPSHVRVRRGLTRSFQVMNIFPRLTVLHNILLPVLVRLGRTLRPFSPLEAHPDALDEAGRILREVGLWEDHHRQAGVLSHGDQRRLELGIAVAADPACCLLDEPSSGMNPVERMIVLELIRKLYRERQTTFVIIEHDMDVVFSLAERIVVMNRGRILADGPPDAIRDNREVRDTYLGEEWAR
jgi:branched-chain amino acid transport system ATP-binding protein